MKRILIVIIYFIFSSSFAQGLEERDVKEIKSKSRLIVKEFEGLLNLISNNQMYDSEVEEIITNSLDSKNVNRLFKDPKVIVEDDLNPELINKKRNVDINTYLANFNLQYNKTSDFSIFFDDITVSDVFNKNYFFLIVNYTSTFKSSFSQEQKLYNPIKRSLELELVKNDNGKWFVTIASLTNTMQPNFDHLLSYKAEVTKSTNRTISFLSDNDSDSVSSEEQSFFNTEANYDAEYYSLLRDGEYAFNEERYDDATFYFEKANQIKNYDSYNTVMLGRSKRLYEVQLLNSKEFLIDLYSKQAFTSHKNGDLEIAIKRYQSILKLQEDSNVRRNIEILERRVLAKGDVTFFLTLPANNELLKDLNKKSKGKDSNIEYELGKALLIQRMYGISKDPKELKNALDPLNLILSREPEFIRARLARAEISSQLLEYKSSLNDYSYLIDKNAENYLFYIERGRIHLLANNSEAAIADFTKSTEINPIAPEGHFELGKIYLAANNIEGAEYHFKQCISSQYSNPAFHYFYARAIGGIDLLKSLDHLKISRELDIDFKLERQIEKVLADYSLQIESILKSGNYQFAENLVNKSLEVNENSSSALIQLAILLKYRKEYKEAIPILERLLTLNPNSQSIKYELAENYSQAGLFDQSFSLFSQIISNLEDARKKYLKNYNFNQNAVSAYDKEYFKNYVGMGNLFFNNKKYSEAIQYYNKAKEIQNSSDYSYLLLLANAYSNLGFSKEALSTASEGLKLDPKNLNFLYLKGLIYFNINDYENSAINFLQSVTSPDLKDGSNYHLAMVNFKQKKFVEAFNFFKLISNQFEEFDRALEYAFLISLRLEDLPNEEVFLGKIESYYTEKKLTNKFETLLLTREVFKNNLLDLESTADNLLKIEPNNARLLYSLAMLNFKNKKIESGYTYLERALRTKQLFEADLYLDSSFPSYADKRVNKMIKDYL